MAWQQDDRSTVLGKVPSGLLIIYVEFVQNWSAATSTKGHDYTLSYRPAIGMILLANGGELGPFQIPISRVISYAAK